MGQQSRIKTARRASAPPEKRKAAIASLTDKQLRRIAGQSAPRPPTPFPVGGAARRKLWARLMRMRRGLLPKGEAGWRKP